MKRDINEILDGSINDWLVQGYTKDEIISAL